MTTPGGPSEGSAKSGVLLFAETLDEAKKKTGQLPEFLQANWKRFTKSASQKYQDFSVSYGDDGGYVFKTTKPGDVSGSRADYFKKVDSFGTTTASYKLTYDPNGELVHRKDKM